MGLILFFTDILTVILFNFQHVRLSHFFRGLMTVIATGSIHFTADYCFDDYYVEKQPVAWKEYLTEYW